MRKLIATVKKHKIITVVIILILGGGGYYWYNSANSKTSQVSYITEAAAKQTVITSVSGSGQMLNSNQVDLKPKVSGDIIKVAVVASQTVKQGDIIAQIDATDAYKAVRDAQTNLESAQLALDKLKKPATEDVKFQTQNALASAQVFLDKLKQSQPIDYKNAEDSLQTAKDNLAKAYSDTFTAISNVYLNLPNIMSSLNDILYSDKISQTEISVGKGQVNISALMNSTYEYDQPKIKSYQSIAETDYASAKTAYDISYADFKNASIYSDNATLENLLAETLNASKAIAQCVKSENNYLTSWTDSRNFYNFAVFAQVTAYQANLNTYAGQANSAMSSLSNAQTTIKNNKDIIDSADNSLKVLTQNQPLDLLAAQNSVKEKQYALANLLAGADPLDLRNQQLTVDQRRNALADAQNALADYTIRAPFDGVIALVNSKVGDPASSGTAIATIITNQQIAQISLNELDAAKIKAGQKVNLTFDAIDSLEITGKVAQIDAIGTVSQGVVSFTVKIVLDTQDQRIKAGMSVNTTIITNVKTDVLTVPNSAVKTNSNSGSYVQILDASGQPQNVIVQIGLADDTNTEIISGLNEGDKVITQTITSASTTASQTSSTANRGAGGFGGGAGSLGGAATRVLRGN